MATDLVITGGGSGGHLNPALALIKYLEENEPKRLKNTVFIGGQYGMIGESQGSIESRKIPATGVQFIGIRAGKLHRHLNLQMIRLLSRIFLGFFDAWQSLRRLKPQVIFATGGFVSLPVVIVGKLLGAKVIMHEQTTIPGLANKINSKFADQILISFEISAQHFPQRKVRYIGALIQPDRFSKKLPAVLAKDYAAQLQKLTNGSKPFIFITGGGLGSHKINSWVLQNIEELSLKYNILLQTGENEVMQDYEKLLAAKQRLSASQAASFHPIKWFGSEIGFIYHHAELVIARPGANTVQELLETANKAILIPIKSSAGGEQLQNAQVFISHQTGLIADEDQLDQELIEQIDLLLSKGKKQSEASAKTNTIGEIWKVLLENIS